MLGASFAMRQRQAHPLAPILLSLPLALALGACKNDGDKDPDKDNDPDFWLVGDQGQMFRVGVDGDSETYPLEQGADLRAIACLGHETAWVVGEGGTVLHSRDGGQSWDSVEVGLLADWSALAISEAAPEGSETVWIAGEGGALVRTRDGGRSWETLGAEALAFTGIATDPAGERALATAADGSLWAFDTAGEGAQIHATEHALRGVATAADGTSSVAVGDQGTLLLGNAAEGWALIELPTTRDLFAARISADADTVVAVGEAGVLLRLEGGELVDHEELLDGDLSLRALHLGAEGFGQAVGDAGTLLRTHDGGHSWTLEALPTTVTLRGVDDIHGAGHL